MSFEQGELIPKPVAFGDSPYTAGVINRFRERSIPEAALVSGKNMDLSDPSKPKKRDGYCKVNSVMPEDVGPCYGLGFLDQTLSAQLLVMATNNGVYVTANPDGNGPLTQAQTVPDGETLSVSDFMPMEQSDDLLWLMPRAAEVWVLRSTGELIRGGTENGSPPIGATGGVWFKQRMMLQAGDRVFFSQIRPTQQDIKDKVAFDRTFDVIDLSPPFGGQHVALKVWNRRYLLSFYTTGIMAIDFNSADPALSPVEVIEPRYGCVAPESIVSVGSDLYFQDQYGDFRSLARTLNDAQSGMDSIPVSINITREIPGKINPRYLGCTKAVLLRDQLRLWTVQEELGDELGCARHEFIFDFTDRSWHGPNVYHHRFSQLIVSNVRKAQSELYGTIEGNLQLVRFGGEVYSDDGNPVVYEETTRRWDLNTIQQDKKPFYAELQGLGWLQGQAEMLIRANPNDDFERVFKMPLESTEGVWPIYDPVLGVESSFPIFDTDFPLLETDFPLFGGTEDTRGSELWPIYDPGSAPVNDFPLLETDFPILETDFPLYGDTGVLASFPIFDDTPLVTTKGESARDCVGLGDFPLFGETDFPLLGNNDFPVLGASYPAKRGRWLQFQIREDTLGPFERHRYLGWATIENPRFDGEVQT